MRKILVVAFAHVLALAFLVVGSVPARAFGSEVLGCTVSNSTTGWTANSCTGNTDVPAPVVHFSPQNLSGSYSMSWTLTMGTTTTTTTTAITANCSSTVTTNCINGGCTATSTTCDVKAQGGRNNRTYTASLRLTQSGLSRTIQAQALLYGDTSCVPTC
jgi:hypothetical protein